MSKLSFRARALDASKPLPIYRSDEIPDNADAALINRAVPQMPTGMEKEEESEHHLQRAICAGSLIPTPEVFSVEDVAYYDKLYPENYKLPRQLIYMQPFTMEADIPDYDMDSEDEIWVNSQAGKLELTPEKFEEMMDRLEKGSGQTVVTLQEAKALIKEDDDLIIAVYDYWLNKRLKTQHPLIPQVRTEARFGVSNHNPYIAFRRRTEKMQTRKNRKNDESSYEKMLKLKRDLTRAVTLLEMVKRREKSKRELLHLTIEVFEKRFQAGDFTGQLVNDALLARPARPAFTPLFQPNSLSSWGKDEHLVSALTRKEKRHYKKRRHKSSTKTHASSSMLSSGSALGYASSQGLGSTGGDLEFLSSEEEATFAGTLSEEEEEDEGPFAFRRKKDCSYHAPIENGRWPWEGGPYADKRYRFCQTSVSNPAGKGGYRRVGFGRRRVGRGGRIILDRMSYRDDDDFWRSMGYSVMDSSYSSANKLNSSATPPGFPVQSVEPNGLYPKLSGLLPKPSFNSPHSPNAYSEEKEFLHFRPKTPERRPEDTLLSSEVAVPSDDDLEIEDCFQTQEPSLLPPIESIAPPSLGPYLGAVVSKGEAPLFFDTRDLLQDPVVYNDTGASKDGRLSDDLVLLDAQSSELSHAYYLYSCENPDASDFGRDWLSESDYKNPWLSSPCPLDEPMDVEPSSSSSSTSAAPSQLPPPLESSSENSSSKPKSDTPPDEKKNNKDNNNRNNNSNHKNHKSSSHSNHNGDDNNSSQPPSSSSSSRSSSPPSSRTPAASSKETSSSNNNHHHHHDDRTTSEDVEMGSEEEIVETVVGSGGMNFINVGNIGSESSEKRRCSVDDKENNDRISIRGVVVGGGSSNGGGVGGGGFIENGADILTGVVVTGNNNNNNNINSVESSSSDVINNNEDSSPPTSSSSSRTPNNNNIINVNSSRSNSTFQLVVDSSVGLGSVVGEGLVDTSSSLVAKSVVVGSDSNNTSGSTNKPRTNGLQLVNMKNYGGSPEKLCHIVT